MTTVRRLKIIQLVTSRKRRGAEISAALLSDELIRIGHELWFVGLYATGDDLEVEGGRNLDLSEVRNVLNWRLLYKLRSLIDEVQPDIIQANGSDTFKYAAIALMDNPKPTLIYRNISKMSHWVNGRQLIEWFYKLLARRVDFFCSVGVKANSDIQDLLKLDKYKVGIIKRGIPFNFLDKPTSRLELQEKFGIHVEDFVLAQVGNLSKEKNIEFSIHLVNELRFRIPNIRLLIVGDGTLKKDLQKLVQELSLTKHVIFLGYQKQTALFFNAAEIHILTSWIEGVPGVVMEASIQGTPTVGVDVGGISETIFHDKTGVLVPGHDLELFKSAILALYDDPKKRIDLGAAAKEWVRSNHDLKENTKRFEELYFKLLEERKG